MSNLILRILGINKTPDPVGIGSLVVVINRDPYFFINDNWKKFCKHLKLGDDKIASIQPKVRKGREIFVKTILEAWKSMCGQNAKIRHIKKALKSTGLLSLYNSVCEQWTEDDAEVIFEENKSYKTVRLNGCNTNGILELTWCAEDYTFDIYLKNLQENPFTSDLKTADNIFKYYFSHELYVTAVERYNSPHGDQKYCDLKGNPRPLKITFQLDIHSFKANPILPKTLLQTVITKIQSDSTFSDHGFEIVKKISEE